LHNDLKFVFLPTFKFNISDIRDLEKINPPYLPFLKGGTPPFRKKGWGIF
jgi:hypothetical protein